MEEWSRDDDMKILKLLIDFKMSYEGVVQANSSSVTREEEAFERIVRSANSAEFHNFVKHVSRNEDRVLCPGRNKMQELLINCGINYCKHELDRLEKLKKEQEDEIERTIFFSAIFEELDKEGEEEDGGLATKEFMFKTSKTREDDDFQIMKSLIAYKKRKGYRPALRGIHKIVEESTGEKVCAARLKERVLELEMIHRRGEIGKFESEMKSRNNELARLENQRREQQNQSSRRETGNIAANGRDVAVSPT